MRLHDNGKPAADIHREYDICKSTLQRWAKGIHESGSTKDKDNRTPEQERILALVRENKQMWTGAGGFKNGRADIRPRVAAITGNADRYPMSARCEIPGVPRSTCCGLRGRGREEDRGDEIDDDVREASGANAGAYGTGRNRRGLAKRGITASRRRIGRSIARQGLGGRRCDARFEPRPSRPNEADAPVAPNREFDGHAPHTHVCGDLTYVRVPGRRGDGPVMEPRLLVLRHGRAHCGNRLG